MSQNTPRFPGSPRAEVAKMTIEEKVLHGGAYLIQDSPPAAVFTPEDFSEEQIALGRPRSRSSATRSSRTWRGWNTTISTSS